MREVERTSSGSLSWNSLEAFKAVRRQTAQAAARQVSENVAEKENVLEEKAVSLASSFEFSTFWKETSSAVSKSRKVCRASVACNGKLKILAIEVIGNSSTSNN